MRPPLGVISIGLYADSDVLGICMFCILCRTTTLDLTVVMGALYSACLFLGVSNSSSVQPVVAIERTVYYRETAAGTYSSFPYAAAQVSFRYRLFILLFVSA